VREYYAQIDFGRTIGRFALLGIGAQTTSLPKLELTGLALFA
jgi:hypothetical protein